MAERTGDERRIRMEAVLRGSACLRAAHPYLENALHELIWERDSEALEQLRLAQKMAEGAVAVILTAQRALRESEDAG